jgi:16S rRNA G527 N7-methylase RsmG
MNKSLLRALAWASIEPTPRTLERLSRLRDWLIDEAAPAGGIGPREVERIYDRHIVDSLLFAGVWQPHGPVMDLGTGVGLPGLPLAIAFPDRGFQLVDRSGRRISLVRRAIRVLELTNVEAIEADIVDCDWTGSTVVTRASLPPGRFRRLAADRGAPPELLMAGSHRQRPRVAGFETLEIPAEILDRPVWILRMAGT